LILVVIALLSVAGHNDPGIPVEVVSPPASLQPARAVRPALAVAAPIAPAAAPPRRVTRAPRTPTVEVQPEPATPAPAAGSGGGSGPRLATAADGDSAQGSGGTGSGTGAGSASGRGGGGGQAGSTGIGTKQAVAPPAPRVVPASLLTSSQPPYPVTARRRRAEGVVLVRARIGVDGKVLESALAQSSGAADLDRAALEGVRAWRFQPERRGARSVESWVKVPVRFQLAQGPR